MQKQLCGRHHRATWFSLWLLLLLPVSICRADFFGDFAGAMNEVGKGIASGVETLGKGVVNGVEYTGNWTVATTEGVAGLVQGNPDAFIRQINRSWADVKSAAGWSVENIALGLPAVVMDDVLQRILTGEARYKFFDQGRRFVGRVTTTALDSMGDNVAEVSHDVWDVAKVADSPEAFARALAAKNWKWSPASALSYVFTEPDPGKGVEKAAGALWHQYQVYSTFSYAGKVATWAPGLGSATLKKGVFTAGKIVRRDALDSRLNQEQIHNGLLQYTLAQSEKEYAGLMTTPEGKAAMCAIMASVATEVRNKVLSESRLRSSNYKFQLVYDWDMHGDQYFINPSNYLARVAADGKEELVGSVINSTESRFTWMILWAISGARIGIDPQSVCWSTNPRDINDGTWRRIGRLEAIVPPVPASAVTRAPTYQQAPPTSANYVAQVSYRAEPNTVVYITDRDELVSMTPQGPQRTGTRMPSPDGRFAYIIMMQYGWLGVGANGQMWGQNPDGSWSDNGFVLGRNPTGPPGPATAAYPAKYPAGGNAIPADFNSMVAGAAGYYEFEGSDPSARYNFSGVIEKADNGRLRWTDRTGRHWFLTVDASTRQLLMDTRGQPPGTRQIGFGVVGNQRMEGFQSAGNAWVRKTDPEGATPEVWRKRRRE